MSRSILRLAPVVFALAVLALLAFAWSMRAEGHISPQSGLGYWLGIAGGSMMLLLLLYPLRKRVRWLRWLGSVPGWFRLHMVFGILGPALVVIHSNFAVGALNSAASLVAMLVVVASGIAGRYLYAKVHRGLYGRKTAMREILDDARLLRAVIESDPALGSKITAELEAFEARSLRERRGLWRHAGSLLLVGLWARRSRRRVLKWVQASLKAHGRDMQIGRREQRRRLAATRKDLALYFAAAQRATRFTLYERLFALWHVLHLPLFLLLVISATVHIVAVHLY